MPASKNNALNAVSKCAKDLLDAFFDMSPLEYAQSRGLPCMSDTEGDNIVNRLREALAAEERVKTLEEALKGANDGSPSCQTPGVVLNSET